MLETIYKLNFQSGHYYIGRTKNIKNRIRKHFAELKKNRHQNSHLQSVFNLYGYPEVEVLIKECNGEEEEQKLLDINFGNHFCCNLSKSSRGGSGINSIPPIIDRDKSNRCNIKTTDFENLEKLAKILPITKIAKYYKVHKETIWRLCKKHKWTVVKTYHKNITKNGCTLKDDLLVAFLLDSPNMNITEMSKKYKVKRETIYRWQDRFNAFHCRLKG